MFKDSYRKSLKAYLYHVTDGVVMHDQVRFITHSPQLEYPISLPLMPRERLTTDRILAEIERVIQSNGAFTLDKSITVNIIHVEMPYGGTGSSIKVRIQNNDNLCLSRAIVVAKARVDNDERHHHISNSQRPLQTQLGRELHERANVALGQCT